MHITIIAVGNRMPNWAADGYREYAGRMPPECSLELKEIPSLKRTKDADLEKIKNKEGEKILKAIPKSCKVIAMEVLGKMQTTESLAEQLEGWMQEGEDVVFLIGGPEGLSLECQNRADLRWSLSPMTLPHPMVRVVLAEQLYRAWSILKKHPYHR